MNCEPDSGNAIDQIYLRLSLLLSLALQTSAVTLGSGMDISAEVRLNLPRVWTWIKWLAAIRVCSGRLMTQCCELLLIRTVKDALA